MEPVLSSENMVIVHHGAAGDAYEPQMVEKRTCRDLEIMKDLAEEISQECSAALKRKPTMNCLPVARKIQKVTGKKPGCQLGVLYAHAQMYRTGKVDAKEIKEDSHKAHFDAKMTHYVAETQAMCIVGVK